MDSVDYLLKPFPLARLKKALEKVANNLSKNKASEEAYLTSRKRLVSRSDDRVHLIKVDDIVFFKAENGVTKAFQFERCYPIKDTLDQLEQALDSEFFVRIHRSYLINIDHVKEIQRWFNGKLMVLMEDSKTTELSTSRSGADKLKDLLQI